MNTETTAASGMHRSSGSPPDGSPPANARHGHANAIPDLDAGVPVLKAADIQRLNRKALVFLAGIVALMIVAAVWLFRSASAPGERSPAIGGEEVRVPEAPRAVAEPELPPLPAVPHVPPSDGVPAIPLATEPVSGAVPPLPAAAPAGATLLERRIAEGGMQPSNAPGLPGMLPPEAYAQQMLAIARGGNEDKAEAPPVAMAQPITNADLLLARGTYLRCIMETRIVTDVPGFTSCVITEPVYSVNGHRLLLPRGSKVSGTYRSESSGIPRVAVVWDRILTPDGIDVRMASPGVDALGGAGHPGDYDAHWGSRIASALLVSLIGDAFKYTAAKHGPESTTITNSGNEYVRPYESDTARAMERLANQALEHGAARKPTVTIHQGALVNIYVARDVDFSSVLR